MVRAMVRPESRMYDARMRVASRAAASAALNTCFASRGSDDPDAGNGGGGTVLAPRQRQETARPPRWRVLLLNDDFTTMDFVIDVLQGVFGHDYAAAFHIMLRVHRTGSGVAGVYRREVAEAKAAQVQERARAAGHPLRCVCEPE